MVAEVSDSAVAPDLTGAAEALVLSSVVSSAPLPVVNPHPVRKIALNVVRFASVLIGAGLLLRTGAAEQAVSAKDAEKPQPQRPAKSRLVLPQPAFGRDLDAGKGSGVSAGGIADPAGGTAPQVAFAAEAAPRQGSAAQAHASKAARPASADTSGLVARADTSAVPPVAVARPSAALAAAAPMRFAAAKVAAAKAAVSPVHAGSQAQAAVSPALILAPTRHVAASGLLAPVSVVSRTVPTAVSSSSQTRSAGSARPAATSSLASGGTLASAQPQPALRPAAAAPALAVTQRAPVVPGNAPAVSGGPSPAAPVKISLAPPVMRPGPRTTVLTSDIRDVMRRPASAWDYAEALPPELTGRAPQQSASAQPQGLQPQAVEMAAAQPRTAMPQMPAARVAVQRTAPVRITPSQTTSTSVSAEAGASPRGRAAMAVSSERQAAAALSPAHTALPASDSGRAVARAEASGPVALLDLPPDAARQVHPAVRAVRHLAMAAHGRRSLPARGRGSFAAKAALANVRHKPDRSDMAETSGLAAPPDKSQAALPSANTARAEPDFRSAAVRAGTSGTAQLADASAGGGDQGLSLRDRIPRPAF